LAALWESSVGEALWKLGGRGGPIKGRGLLLVLLLVVLLLAEEEEEEEEAMPFICKEEGEEPIPAPVGPLRVRSGGRLSYTW